MPHLTTAPTVLLLVAALAYLLGSIPFGIVITRAMGLGDLRDRKCLQFWRGYDFCRAADPEVFRVSYPM